MGRRYCVPGSCTTAAGSKTASILSATTVRPAIYDIIIGAAAAPGDQSANWGVLRATALGTGTAFTPNALDAGDPASLVTAAITHSAEPTYTANSNLFQASINQRTTFRWVAFPGSELKSVVTASNGIGLRAISSTGTQVQETCVYFEE